MSISSRIGLSLPQRTCRDFTKSSAIKISDQKCIDGFLWSNLKKTGNSRGVCLAFRPILL